MARGKRQQPKVRFEIEARLTTSEQIEAGKRLFARLIARALVSDDAGKSKRSIMDANGPTRAAGEAAAPPNKGT